MPSAVASSVPVAPSMLISGSRSAAPRSRSARRPAWRLEHEDRAEALAVAWRRAAGVAVAREPDVAARQAGERARARRAGSRAGAARPSTPRDALAALPVRVAALRGVDVDDLGARGRRGRDRPDAATAPKAMLVASSSSTGSAWPCA